MTSSETDDAVALMRLQSRYADVISRRAWSELHELFLPDTEVRVDTVTAAPRTFAGPDEFGAFVAEAIARFDHFVLAILNNVVDVGPGEDEATGRFFMTEVRHDTASDTWQDAHGVYEDRYRRVDGRWWIADRHYTSLARGGPDSTVLGLPERLRGDR